MGHRQVGHRDRFVLDLVGRHCLVLVQVEGAGHHGLARLLLLVGLVAAGGPRVGVLVAAVWVVLALQLAGSAPPSAAPSAPAARRQALGLLGGDSRSYGERVGVVLPHVFH